MSTAAIVVIGNEILSAKIADENGPWLTRELRALGVDVRRIETIPDEISLIVDALHRAKSQAKWVFTSGGIGPTHDDVTIAAVAEAFGRRVVPDPRILGMLQAHYGDRLNAARRRLADVPEGAEVEWHEGAYFPVVSLEGVAVLPGPPVLFKEGFGRIRERYRSAPLFGCAIYLALGEGELAEHLDATVARFARVSIGSYPRFDERADYRVKITFDGRSQEEVREAFAFFRKRVPGSCILREEEC